MRDEELRKLFAELEKYENSGVSMKLENQVVSPMQIVEACIVREETNYMRDYIYDEEGNLKELTFYNIEES